MLTSYDQKHSAQMDVESRVRQSLSVISSPVNHLSFRSDLSPPLTCVKVSPDLIGEGLGERSVQLKL